MGYQYVYFCRPQSKKAAHTETVRKADFPALKPDTNFLSEFDAMNKFFKFKFEQDGHQVFVIVKVITSLGALKTVSLEVQSYW